MAASKMSITLSGRSAIAGNPQACRRRHVAVERTMIGRRARTYKPFLHPVSDLDVDGR